MRSVALVLAAALLVACASDGAAPAAADGPASRTDAATSAPPTATGEPTAPPAPPPPAPPPPPPPAPDPALDEPLLAAATAGDAAAVADLLARGGRVAATNSDGATPLVLAAYGNHLDAARLLIAAGADVNAADATQQSAYLIATSEVGDDPRLLELTIAGGAVLDAKDRFDGTGLIRAADRGHVAILQRLLATGGIPVDHVNRLGWTALHEAIVLGDGSARYVESVRVLVAAGADVDLPTARDGVRPLRHARDRGFAEIAAILEAAGATA